MQFPYVFKPISSELNFFMKVFFWLPSNENFLYCKILSKIFSFYKTYVSIKYKLFVSKILEITEDKAKATYNVCFLYQINNKRHQFLC